MPHLLKKKRKKVKRVTLRRQQSADEFSAVSDVEWIGLSTELSAETMSDQRDPQQLTLASLNRPSLFFYHRTNCVKHSHTKTHKPDKIIIGPEQKVCGDKSFADE